MSSKATNEIVNDMAAATIPVKFGDSNQSSVNSGNTELSSSTNDMNTSSNSGGLSVPNNDSTDTGKQTSSLDGNHGSSSTACGTTADLTSVGEDDGEKMAMRRGCRRCNSKGRIRSVTDNRSSTATSSMQDSTERDITSRRRSISRRRRRLSGTDDGKTEDDDDDVTANKESVSGMLIFKRGRSRCRKRSVRRRSTRGYHKRRRSSCRRRRRKSSCPRKRRRSSCLSRSSSRRRRPSCRRRKRSSCRRRRSLTQCCPRSRLGQRCRIAEDDDTWLSNISLDVNSEQQTRSVAPSSSRVNERRGRIADRSGQNVDELSDTEDGFEIKFTPTSRKTSMKTKSGGSHTKRSDKSTTKKSPRVAMSRRRCSGKSQMAQAYENNDNSDREMDDDHDADEDID